MKDRLRQGKGAEVTVPAKSIVDYDVQLIVVPSPLYSDDSKLRLLIVAVDMAAYVWDGKDEVGIFDLVSSGFTIDIAGLVLDIIRSVFYGANENRPTGHEQRSITGTTDK